MQLKSINKSNISNQTVLVRVDYNVPLEEKNGKVIVADDTRIKASLETIDFLLKNNAKVILMSHLGRPEGKVDPTLSLKPIADHLSKLLGKKVVFDGLRLPAGEAGITDHESDDWKLTADSPTDHLHSTLTLIENLRFSPGEETNDKKFAKQLASLADIYINDAFSACHRAHASVEAITNYLPSFAGLALAKEVENLSTLMDEPKRPFVVVVGGAKISDKVSAIENLAKIADTVLVGGGVANNFLKADGFDVAKSYMEDSPADAKKKGVDFVKLADNLLDTNQQEHTLLEGYIPLPKIIYPIDVIAAKNKESKETHVVNLLSNSVTQQPASPAGGLSNSDMYLDIGPKTVKLFSQVIKQAKTVFWNGPMGVWEESQFASGTKKIAQSIANSQAKTILGGGDTISAIDHFKLKDSYTYVSAAGGASLEFLSGKMLPGIKPLAI